MLRLAKALPFFNTSEDALARSFITPTNGFYISVPTRCSLDNYHGPGTVFQGQLNLQLTKPIRAPCRLRVIFSCLHTIPMCDFDSSSQPSSSTSLTEVRVSSDSSSKGQGNNTPRTGPHQHSLFEIEHTLVEDEPLHPKRHTFMFNIKFPRVNLPASMTVSLLSTDKQGCCVLQTLSSIHPYQHCHFISTKKILLEDGDRFVVYSLHAELSFQTTPDDPSTQAMLSSPAVHLKYLPLIPTSIPHFPVIEMAQVMDPYSNRPLVKASLESPQRGVCPGESLPLSLTITNSSETDLVSIHLGLVRVISYPASSSSPSTTSSVLTAEPTTVHTVTLPVSQTVNKDSTWIESVQFKVPSNLGLIPTTNKVITPLYKVDYYLSVSLPIASRGSGLASWFTPSVRNPPPVDISLIRNATGSTGAESGTETGNATENDNTNSRAGPRKTSVDKIIKANLHIDRIPTLTSTLKWPTLVQLPIVPVIVGTVPYSVTERQLRWPIPNYLDVMDRPRFVRDKFEEEMMQHLKSLETLIVEEEDENDIENIIQEAVRKSASSGESDEDDSHSSRVPARFRDGGGGGGQSRRKGSLSTSGLGTPPPSPPSTSPMAIHTLPRVGRRSMSPKSRGLSKELLLEMHHSKVQQSLQAGLQSI
ncbi:hypothetical protein BC939DRAFT_451204 [Gamsiella multidivaricata]|uniref:uncharacterized protein n=1 Tax=Gamsiella multidivaricata TaxID=101098 RepID=UPI00221F3E11|nr:uncharacterized protein BC939DRAFT_451204 [Gamsiella multidivaricata]KAI7823505.1 hypothetical protein BC939DRAFT_451204 [Gamsiella multidivaricata]